MSWTRKTTALLLSKDSGRVRWARRVGVGTIVAGIMVAGFAIAAPVLPSEWNGDPTPPADVQAAIDGVFTTDPCVTASEAEEELDARLLGFGLDDWSIRRGPGVTTSGCVSTTVTTRDRQILLIMALRPEVKSALFEIANELLDDCLSEGEAMARVRNVLESLGEENWELRTDGPIGGPIERIDEIQRHVDAGCFIYSGTGWTQGGVRLFFVGGRRDLSTHAD